jgi:aspartate 4-decarboxylase
MSTEGGTAPTALTHDEECALAELSPFEFKARLLQLAASCSTAERVLDAGRGNPNWVATTPRAAFFLLGQFALTESRRVWEEPDLGGMPSADGVAGRLRGYLAEHADGAHVDRGGAELLARTIDYGESLGFVADAFVHELVDGVIGDRYPGPDRICNHAEQILREYLADELLEGTPPPGDWDLFAVEGGTAAICYVFDSLATNLLLRPGDRIALMVPAFTPYLEIPRLDRYDLDVVELHASAVDEHGQPTWQFPDEEVDKLADPSVKALFVVNPSNPPSVMLARPTLDRIADIVATQNPGLIIVTDDVYGTFVPGFRSLMDVLPANTIAIYSFSKYFGATGWRLGVIALYRDNVLDRAIAALPADELELLDCRYETIATDTHEIRFIDRMVADSRQVALNHTAGLSLPQQVQMTLFATFALLDEDQSYKDRTRSIVNHRLARLHEGMEIPLTPDVLRAGYYAEVDLMRWAQERYGAEFATWLADAHEPIDPVVRLAEDHGVVLLHGGGFDGPVWSVRVSLANLEEDCYVAVGAAIRGVFDQYVSEWKSVGP